MAGSELIRFLKLCIKMLKKNGCRNISQAPKRRRDSNEMHTKLKGPGESLHPQQRTLIIFVTSHETDLYSDNQPSRRGRVFTCAYNHRVLLINIWQINKRHRRRKLYFRW